MTFLIENFLLHSTRQAAEINLYRLVMSVKEIFLHHPLVHTFARLFYFCDGSLRFQEFPNIVSKKGKDGISFNSDGKVRTQSTSISRGHEIGGKGSSTNKSGNVKKLILSDCVIPLPMCTVYLYTRSCLLKEYSGENAPENVPQSQRE